MQINRLLLDVDRVFYQSVIDEMFVLCPDIMSRKITLANVQQAFTLSEVVRIYKDNDKLLCVGAFEDSVSGSIQGMGIDVVDIDQDINYSLTDFRKITEEKFDIIFATSVIEHERNDEEFIENVCHLLNPGGHGVLTLDFNNDYRIGTPLPQTVVRLYTDGDMVRLFGVLDRCGCAVVDEPDYSGEPDFIYQGHLYAFATLVFRKN